LYEELRTEICRIMQLASTKGWSPGSSANTSARVPGTNHVCVKSTGTSMAFGALDPESSVVVIGLDGNHVDSVRKPSMEVRFHLGIYKVRPDVGAVLHAHSPYATAYAVANQEFPMVSALGRLMLKKVPLLAFAPPGARMNLRESILGPSNLTNTLKELRSHCKLSIRGTLRWVRKLVS
jgi:L-fuculose-phosphate aldolase